MPSYCRRLEEDTRHLTDRPKTTMPPTVRPFSGLVFYLLLVAQPLAHAASPAWILPSGPKAPLLWGRKDGIVFGLPSEGGLPGPRGLVRVGVISPETGKPQLLNFIAIEPVVLGPGPRFSRMAFSELEPSKLDAGSRGKRLWAIPQGAGGAVEDVRTVTAGHTTIERLSVRIEVERFTANGAHVYLIASMDSDRPHDWISPFINLKIVRQSKS